MIDEEETENLDSLEEKGTLTFEMGADGFLDLDTAHDILADLADSISFVEFQTIEETDGAFYAIDALYNEVVFVFSKMTRLVVEVNTFLDKHAFVPCGASGSHRIKADACLRVAFADYDLLKIDIAVCGGAAYL